MKNKVLDQFKSMLKDESAQGATEYILLLVVVVAVVMMFKGQILKLIQAKLGDVEGGMNSINTSP